ncbi:hypothetical protein ASPWEDRAFT_23418 [Aspergillus wentii DTO 134E9]|uniref:Uncharacterized protein n=1 Tax=Aspergillus wentii DTO 134E9 TaxID=1073089 RepID=A0A1L9S2D2_ASPWE|nr:uncharacterized protein ASPWEDRAFT_23418 [Aspergillus wentii DTO 134E9]OJJ41317.1 hypothetical protein ASPWEDRAFT_23418 [Aspergillus wentii DTO 134E9]
MNTEGGSLEVVMVESDKVDEIDGARQKAREGWLEEVLPKRERQRSGRQGVGYYCTKDDLSVRSTGRKEVEQRRERETMEWIKGGEEERKKGKKKEQEDYESMIGLLRAFAVTSPGWLACVGWATPASTISHWSPWEGARKQCNQQGDYDDANGE